MQTYSVQDQLLAGIINKINQERIAEELSKLSQQDISFGVAIEQVEKVRAFVSKPEHILGSNLTKHGEIAEQFEVCGRNSIDALVGNFDINHPNATFDGVARTAPEDYLINGTAVQSKFINGENAGLQHVLNHMEKYDYFGRDGSYYHIPKDQYETIAKISRGEHVEGLSQKTIDAIKIKIEKIEANSGKPFDEVIKPSISKYADVQQGKIHETLDNHEKYLSQENEQIKEHIKETHQASIHEGLKAAGSAAAVGGAISLGMGLYQKYKTEGKNPFHGDLNIEDWKQIGLDTAKGSAIGGVTGFAVYGLTNCAGLSAPLAGAFVSATKGVSSLAKDLHAGKISFDEFQMNAIFVCADSAAVGLATLAGQALIPIPVLGAVIGSLAGKLACNLLFEEDKKLADKLEKSLEELTIRVDKIYQDLVNRIMSDFNKISNLQKLAFDVNSNMNLVESSINLACAYGVEESKISRNEKDLEDFLFN